MLPVEEALERVKAAFGPLPAEQVSVAEALGRVLADDVEARVTQPPAAVSAMDGYAVRAADVAEPPVVLRTIGEAPAGGAYEGTVGPGEAVRIFTGGPVPDGADAIVIQEDTESQDDRVTVRVSAPEGNYIRPAGLDFSAGVVGLRAGRRLTVRDVGLAAAMNVPWLAVRRKPRVALLATGDEIVRPGDPLGPHQIVSSNTLALAALVTEAGATPIDLGIARDNEDSLRRMAAAAAGADLLVTSGGASVGERDLVQQVLGKVGFELDFWRIAMRPGKPLMFGRIGATPLLGVPGNPVSALVCGLLFLRPAIGVMLGVEDEQPAAETAVLGCDLGANDRRQDYLRARLERGPEGELVATPFSRQDSSMLSTLVAAGCLVVRPPQAPPAKAGDRVEIIRL
ncbi:MAG: molybdopterin molybdotransferase MoeA [Proteobacteria bacterium]|nr:molybdopterin molybdotransferase MoeA [Pseudomonadota bacterium]